MHYMKGLSFFVERFISDFSDEFTIGFFQLVLKLNMKFRQ